jgi:hypothetical protein
MLPVRTLPNPPLGQGEGTRSLLQRCDDLIDDRVGLGAHFVVGGVLDWMRYEDALYFGQAERDGLLFSGVHEYVGGNYYRGLAINFEPY